MRYVHVADGHQRELPPELLVALPGELDPDRRILKLLGARRCANPRHPDGTETQTQSDKCVQTSALLFVCGELRAKRCCAESWNGLFGSGL
jgi:hypothetical protein